MANLKILICQWEKIVYKLFPGHSIPFCQQSQAYYFRNLPDQVRTFLYLVKNRCVQISQLKLNI